MPALRSIEMPAQVLLVEDDDQARETLAAALRLTGYHVRTASDGLAGLRVLETFEPDVVIVDLSLPIASGFDVLNELRAASRTQNTPVIAISGNERGLKLARSNPEFFATIQKPFDPETLVRVVDRARRLSYS